MNGKDIIIDTNILLYYLNGDVNVRQFIDDYNPIISFITELEILSAPELTQNEKLFISDLLKDVTIISYDDKHKENIIKLRAKRKLKLPDSIIVSLAITLGLPIVSADKGLKNIDGLDLIFYKLTET
jgi:predicted nucleic acid-binding protein